MADGALTSDDKTDGGLDEALRRLARYDLTGEYVDGEEALTAFVAEVKAQAAARQ